MDKKTAIAYKALQDLINPIAKARLDTQIGFILTTTKAVAATSISDYRPGGPS